MSEQELVQRCEEDVGCSAPDVMENAYNLEKIYGPSFRPPHGSCGTDVYCAQWSRLVRACVSCASGYYICVAGGGGVVF